MIKLSYITIILHKINANITQFFLTISTSSALLMQFQYVLTGKVRHYKTELIRFGQIVRKSQQELVSILWRDMEQRKVIARFGIVAQIIKFVHLILIKNNNCFQNQYHLTMKSFISNNILNQQTHNCVRLNLSQTPNHQSLHQHLQIRPQDSVEVDPHLLLNSFSINCMPSVFPPDSRPPPFEQLGALLETDRLDSSHPYLNLCRGVSQSYEYFEDESYNQYLPYSTIKVPSFQYEPSLIGERKGKPLSTSEPSYLFQPNSEQELKSDSKNNDLSYNLSVDGEVGASLHQVGLKVTKNVTKNIGKLLFKFIWKHRKTLGEQLKVQKSQWESFMKVISLWKKQNNITRQYLMQRWHGQGQHCAIFRSLSRHFFRKRCLPAIMKSHIRLKRVHYERIHRFSAAITDPEALSSIA